MFVYRSYALDDFEVVKKAIATGKSDREIANVLGFPRSTVQRYRQLAHAPSRYSELRLRAVDSWRPDHGDTYAYLLGVYLGDGHLWHSSPTSWRLTVSLDARYPSIVEEVRRAMETIVPSAKVCCAHRPGATLLIASSNVWSAAFPQHGRGRKHLRPIVLADWQRAVTHEHPTALLRGLIHSDGSRCINRFKSKLPSGRVAQYAYPRYFFTNCSEDILGVFCEHCELVGVRWTRSSTKNVSVSDRKSVAILDDFIGPKA